jgi:nitroreductase/dihydropteridine reductase
MQNIIDAMKWRYATKQFSSQKLTSEQRGLLEETVRMAPTSYGLQPWKLVVVQNLEIREKLKAAAYGQAQITDASAVFVFAVEKTLDEGFVQKYIDNVIATRGVTPEMVEGFKNMMNGSLTPKSEAQKKEWAARQAYIGLGTLLTAAAVESIDVCPMEGFDPAAFDEILGLSEKGLAAVVVAAVGFRSADDAFQNMAKVRRPKAEMILSV